MNWNEPIKDRTWLDIMDRNPKAYLYAEDLNRIEGNIEWLAIRLNQFLFPIRAQAKTSWNEHDVPTTADIKRICDGITEIKDAFYRPIGYQDIPDIETSPLLFSAINLLENNLFLLKMLHDIMVVSFRKTVFKSGTTIFLPKRRMS